MELKQELALKGQRLDLVLIERGEGGPPPDVAALELPDGLDDLRAHNLLTYKSQQEALDAWTLDEPIGHYVNYRELLATHARKSATPGDDQDEAGQPKPDLP